MANRLEKMAEIAHNMTAEELLSAFAIVIEQGCHKVLTAKPEDVDMYKVVKAEMLRRLNGETHTVAYY